MQIKVREYSNYYTNGIQKIARCTWRQLNVMYLYGFYLLGASFVLVVAVDMPNLYTILILQALASYGSFVYCKPNARQEGRDSGPGKPLFLTPHIERGDMAEARRLARVPLFDQLHVESYAGYFTVNKTYDSNHFLWYFPSMSSTRDNDPVIVWLQGGPGSSSLAGLFTENGPVAIKNHTFERREHHWALNHHVIYIDSPVGTGFSFTNHTEGYCTDQTQVGEHLYSTLTQFFQLFPELQKNKFFVTGESYGGKYVPALAYTIHKKNPTAETKINLKGLAIGNGLTDPEHQMMYGEYLYQIGLIDNNERKVFKEHEAKCKKYIKNGQWREASTCFFNFIRNFQNVSGFDNNFNFLHSENYLAPMDEQLNFMLKQDTVRKAIHVGDLPFHNVTLVYKALYPDITKSVAPWVSELLDHYYCLIYSGQLDVIVAYPLTLNYLQNLKFTGSEEYKTAKRLIWRVKGEIAGYVKQAGKLVEVLVRNAGHLVPTDQPEWAMEMIKTFTSTDKFWDN